MVFPTRNHFSKEHILHLLATTIEHYVYPLINNCGIVTIAFHLWMSRARYDTLTTLVNFVEKSWMPQHVTMGLFDAPKTSGIALAKIVKLLLEPLLEQLLEQFKLLTKVIACVKDEGSILKTLKRALFANISCNVLGL